MLRNNPSLLPDIYYQTSCGINAFNYREKLSQLYPIPSPNANKNNLVQNVLSQISQKYKNVKGDNNNKGKYLLFNLFF